MAVLFYLIAFLFSLGQLGRISFYGQHVNIYIYELFLFISLSGLFIKYRFLPIKELWKNSRPVFLFIFALIISFLIGINQYSMFQNAVSFLYLLRIGLYMSYWTYMSYWVKQNRDKKDIIKKGLTIITFTTIVSTTIQYLLYPDLRNLIYLGWDPHLYRTFGVFFDTNIAGAIYGIIFLFSSNLIIKGIFLLFTILSFSRNVYLSLAVSLIYLFLNKKEFKKLFVYLLIGLFLILIVPKPFGEGVNLARTFTIASRIKDYQSGFKLFLKKPFFGYGYNRLKFIREDPTSHAAGAFSSSYLTIMVTSGLMGLIGLISLMRLMWKKTAYHKEILVFIGVASFFDNVFLHPFIMFLLFIILSES